MAEEAHGKDSAEIREIFAGLTEMFKELSGPIKEMIDHVLSRMNGEALGEDVARFYRSLVSNGVPEELAEKMTIKYLEGKLSMFTKIADKIGLTSGALGKTPMIMIGEKNRAEKK